MSAQLDLLATASATEIGTRWEPKRSQPFPSRSLVDVPRAANADPETSHLAADRIKATGALGDQQRRVLDLVNRFPGCTSAELANAVSVATGDAYAKLRTQFARRLPELAGVHIRRGDARVCKVTGSKCVTWWPK